MKALLTLLLAAILVSGCDVDRFTGFKYEAEPLASFARITGKVVNAFDESEGVFKANVSLEGQADSTDVSGNYSIDYVLTSDAQRDRPISILITQDRYYDLDTTLIVRANDITVNWKMVYAAPRVLNSERSLPTLRAEILDYQGINSVSSVRAIITYRDTTLRINFDMPFPMTRIQQIDANTAIYELEVPPIISIDRSKAILLPEAPWSIEAADVDGFIETIKFSSP